MTKLGWKEREALTGFINSGAFDSDEAFELDYAIFKVVSDTNPNYDTLQGLSEPQIRYFASWWTEAEMNEGGFDQFFLNKGPRIVREALAAAAELRLDTVAHLIRRALDAVARVGAPKDWREMQRLLECEDAQTGELKAALVQIDREYFALAPRPPFIERRLRYAAGHAGEFFLA